MENDGRIWLWFADNGNIRKWDRKPFEEGTEYVLSERADAMLDEMTRSCLAERAAAAMTTSPDARPLDEAVEAAFQSLMQTGAINRETARAAITAALARMRPAAEPVAIRESPHGE